MTANPITADDDDGEGEWIVYQSKGMKKRRNSSSRTKAPFVPKRSRKPKTSKKIKRTKISKSAAKKKKGPKKQKREEPVSDEPLKQSPRIRVTLEEFLPKKLQSLELRAYFRKKREGAVIQVPCLNIIVISDDEDEEDEGSSITRPIHILDSPASSQHDLVVEECMATPRGYVTPKGIMASPDFSPIPPMLYMNTPEYAINSPQRYVGYESDSKLLKSSRKRLRFEDEELNSKCQSDDEIWKYSDQFLHSDCDYSPKSPRYPSPARTYDGESVSSDHFDYSCNVITVDINFQDGDVQVRSSPEDDRRAKIEGRKERSRVKIVVSLKEEMSRTTQDYMIREEQISSHPFPQWVEMVLFPRGYSIPHFPLYNGVGCPRRHLVHFLALCGNTIRSQALLLRQFVLSLEGWAADWYFSLPPNSIPDWDTMAERFYRRFYMPQPMEFEMWEPYENISFQAYELLEGTAEEKLEAASNQRDMGGFRPRGLFPSWVEQTPFPLGYNLPNFSIYERHGDPEKHIKLFLRQCGRTTQNQALCLRQFPLSLDGIAFDWYCSLDGFVVPSWEAMKSAFIQSQYFYRWDSQFLRSARESYPQEGEVITDDEHSSVGSTNMVQISDEPKVGDDNGKEIVKVCKTFLTYKRQPRNPNQGSQVPIKEGDAPKEEEQVKYDVLAHLKKIPALLSIYDALKMSPELRKSLIYALSNPDDFHEEVQGKGQKSIAVCMSTVAFGDEDMYAETPDHNRPLFITGFVLNTEISRVMVDGGSAVNLLPKRALGMIGVRLSQLRPCHLVIQGFNQNEQRPMGKVKLRTKFGSIEEDTEFLVIDVNTSYNALLGRPWAHGHMAVPSTYHQCIKYPLPPPMNEGIIIADNDPFNGVEAYYADARFYKKASQNKAKGETECIEAQTKKTFRYIPKSQRKPGASALAPINPTSELKDAFVLPLRKTECTYVESYRKFVVPAKEKGTKPIGSTHLAMWRQKSKMITPK
ncbi:hypothetical protein Vadar_001965 [Vaccinium darrowii]|uniref:Uncharacterized protein n=1 Tax=Vaccinium darrowii TaxID=229202 RepID=A0ACB7X7D7_9ERIC|nr:hypothetical protein Vadar_001965 [Vaccinium darrowii]